MSFKTPMGLEPFEVRIFFGEKFTKFDLALKEIIENQSKLVKRRSVMFSTIWPKNFFFAKTPMGTPLDSIFFTHKKIFQFRFRAHLAVQIKNFFGTIKDIAIWFFGNQGILVSQNSYGYTMVRSLFSDDFFVFSKGDRKLIEIGYKFDSK